jgi:hypothetical protein
MTACLPFLTRRNRYSVCSGLQRAREESDLSPSELRGLGPTSDCRRKASFSSPLRSSSLLRILLRLQSEAAFTLGALRVAALACKQKSLMPLALALHLALALALALAVGSSLHLPGYSETRGFLISWRGTLVMWRWWCAIAWGGALMSTHTHCRRRTVPRRRALLH